MFLNEIVHEEEELEDEELEDEELEEEELEEEELDELDAEGGQFTVIREVAVTRPDFFK